MELFEAISNRRSCRKYSPEPVNEKGLEKILEAAVMAPSPANNQPWEFIVIHSPHIRDEIVSAAETCKKKLFEKSGWKWLEKYSLAFLKEAPLVIAVVGDPGKSGADLFLEEGAGLGYQQACAAAIQNMLLAAHGLELGTLWFTLFEKRDLRAILGIDEKKDPVALVCMGKPSGQPMKTPRKNLRDITRYL